MRALEKPRGKYNSIFFLQNTSMDKKEVRQSLGKNHHFRPDKNPQVVAGTPPKPSWWNNMKVTQPMQITRQPSATSDGTSSPVGSPLGSPPMSSNFTRQLSRSYSSDEHKDSILT